jgi:hypothetical protein
LTARPALLAEGRPARRGAIVVWAIVAVLFAIDQARLNRTLHDPQRLTDLQRWMPIAVDFVANAHEPLYERHPDYIYPPWFLLIVLPFSWLPLGAAAFAAQTLKWWALLKCVQWSFRLAADEAGRTIAPRAAIASLILSARFIINELAELNVNTFVLCGVLASVVLVRTGRPAWGGFVLALITATKVTPALVIVYWLYKREWRVLIGVAAGLVVTLLVLTSLVVGVGPAMAALQGWYEHLIHDFLASGRVYSPQINQSIPGLLNRLFTDTEVFDYAPQTRVYLMLLPPGALSALRVGAAMVVLGVLAVVVRPVRGAVSSHARLAEVSLVLIAMLLLSGYSWKAHYVALLPGYVAALAYRARAINGVHRRLVTVFVFLSFLLCTVPSDLIGPRRADWAEAYGVILFGGVALAGALVAVRVALRREYDKM